MKREQVTKQEVLNAKQKFMDALQTFSDLEDKAINYHMAHPEENGTIDVCNKIRTVYLQLAKIHGINAIIQKLS